MTKTKRFYCHTLLIVSLATLGACSQQSSTTDPVQTGSSDERQYPTPPNDNNQAPELEFPSVEANFHTLRTPSLEQGQFEIITLSTLPDTVTGGDVLVALRGLGDNDSVTVTRNGDDVTGLFQRQSNGDWHGLVTGLQLGDNTLTATANGDAGERVAQLTVKNHPITGPVISGPHQKPFYCRTVEAGLGEPLDENCSVATRYQWYYRSNSDDQYHELTDPYAPYPDDTMSTTTEDGRQVPFVVRVESSTINRGITRIAVLDDPAARGPETPFEQGNWNQRVLYAFGESCGVGYHQGLNRVDWVLGAFELSPDIDTSAAVMPLIGVADMLGKGYLVVHSTMTTLGVHCNDMLSGETTMMVKEYINEHYGLIDFMISAGGSGGAIQQWTTANNFPGLIDVASPILSFTDVVTTAMSAVDCGLLAHYFDNSDLDWPEQKKAAVSGHIGTNICRDWNDLFTNHIKPETSCHGSVPGSARYHPVNNPDGIRCTLQDSTKNLWGTYENGFARRPVDNVGVQYGLLAFNEGNISFDEFLDLNRNIGGFDIDANYVADRMAMEEEIAHIAYLTGRVTGRGAISEIPFIDLNAYVDPVPVLGFHDQIRSYMMRARLQKYSGQDITASIWNGTPNHAQAYPELVQWQKDIQVLEGLGPLENRVGAVQFAKPDGAADRCSISTLGGQLQFPSEASLPLGYEAQLVPIEGAPEQTVPLEYNQQETAEYQGDGVCDTLFEAKRSTRIVAGGPLTEDVIKCQLKPVDAADYSQALSEAQLAQLAEVFPQGVCDWSKPSVGFVEKSLIWASIGGEELSVDDNGNTLPFELHWHAGRSVTVPTHGNGQGDGQGQGNH